MSKWDDLQTKILAKLDIAAEYRAFGLDITGARASASGWLSCRAISRTDASPSAAINVGEGPLRGRYRDLGGNGDSLTFWDFAAKYAAGDDFNDWKSARKHFGKKVGLGKNFPRGDDDDRPEDSIGFMAANPPHFPIMVKGLLAKYPGITAESLLLCGARIATYPKKSPSPRYCVAIPAYGPDLLDGGPTGYCLMAIDGGPIQIFKGEGNQPESVKRMTKGVSGLVGRWGIEHLENAEVVYKVEGITDLLAMQAAIPVELRESHVVVTNLCGTHETGLPRQVAPVFAGKHVVVVHDCDVPGQDGAGLWCAALTGVAVSVRNWVLPYAIEESHGKDLRDWLLDQGDQREAA